MKKGKIKDYKIKNINNDSKNLGKTKKVLNDLEKFKIKQTIEEMKKSQVQPQKMIGKKDFNKPGFAANPSKIIFKDFEIGKKMSLTVEIVNISYTFNSFHLQPLDDDITYFFDIDYRPSGRIPAGMSSKITLHFTPLVNKDYKSSLKLLSETGMCIIPLECYYKKCCINFQNNILDFGIVQIGQEVKMPLIAINSGALGCKYTFMDSNKELLELNDNEIDPYEDLDPNAKNFFYKNIVVHQYDYKKAKNKCDEGIIDKIKFRHIEELKNQLINKAKEDYEKEKIEKENGNGNENEKEKKQKIIKKEKNKDNLSKIEIIEGIPKEKYEEIELKIKEYSDNFKIKTNEDINEYNNLLDLNKNNIMKKFLLKQIKYPLNGNISGYTNKNIPFVLHARFIGEFLLKCFLKIEYNEKVEYKEFQIYLNVVEIIPK